MPDPFCESFRQRMSEFAPGLAGRLGDIPALLPETARGVMGYLLELACKSSHIGFIQVGRRAVVRIPRQWVVERLESAGSGTLDLADEWQFRRFVELCCLVEPALAERVAERGLQSEVAAVREAAADYRGACAEFASLHGSSVAEPPC